MPVIPATATPAGSPPPAKKTAPKKSARECDMERFANWLIEWVSGLDEDGFSPVGRGIVWLKASVIALFLAGVLIPLGAIFFGLFVSHAFIENSPLWLQWVSIAGALLVAFVAFWKGYIRTALAFLASAIVFFTLIHLLVLDPIIAAQWLMIAGVLLFGVPALLVTGVLGSFLAHLIRRLFWRNTPVEKISTLISVYFGALIWLYVLAEAAIVLGVTATWIGIVIGVLGLVGYILIALFWNKDLGIGRFLAFTFQIILLVWAAGVAMPSSISLFLVGHDLRHEWGFYRLKPLTLHQRELDALEDDLAVAKGRQVAETFKDARTDIKNKEPEKAEKRINDLKKTYGENPLSSRIWRKIKKFGDWIDEQGVNVN